MPWPQSAAPDLHLERARDSVGRSKTAWCADYWRGECPVQGWRWRGSQKSNKPSKPPEIAENGEKTDDFAHILAYKSPKTPFSLKSTLQDILTRRFSRNTRIFKITTYAIAELYLFKVSEVIYAPSRTD